MFRASCAAGMSEDADGLMNRHRLKIALTR